MAKGYKFYLGKMLLPVTPSNLQIKINNSNKTVTLINEGEINLLKKAGLTDISFTALLPNYKYRFAVYKNGFQNAAYFLERLEKMKTDTDAKGRLKPFQFIVSRVLPNGEPLFDNNMKVSLEDYKIVEESNNGFDVNVEISLKAYRDYSTKKVKIQIEQAKPIIQNQNKEEEEPIVPVQNEQPEPMVQTQNVMPKAIAVQPKAVVVQSRPAETAPSKSIEELANEVIRGNWGNNPDRKAKLLAAGHDYTAIQARVNEIIYGV